MRTPIVFAYIKYYTVPTLIWKKLCSLHCVVSDFRTEGVGFPDVSTQVGVEGPREMSTTCARLHVKFSTWRRFRRLCSGSCCSCIVINYGGKRAAFIAPTNAPHASLAPLAPLCATIEPFILENSFMFMLNSSADAPSPPHIHGTVSRRHCHSCVIVRLFLCHL